MDLGYHRMPREFCQGQNVNLEKFSLGVSDESIDYIVDTTILRIFKQLCQTCPSTMTKRFLIMRVVQNSFVRTGLGTRQSKADIIRTSDGVHDDLVINESIRLWNENVLQHGLRSVNLCGAEKLTNRGLDRLATVSSSLCWINLQGAQGITGKGLSLLVIEAAATVQHLNLSYCTGVAGAEFAILGQHTKHLKTLVLTKCSQITSSSFRSIFQGCRKLEILDLSYCTKLTDDEIYLLRCRNLKQISLRECNKVTDSGFQSLTTESPNLQDVDCTRGSMTHHFTDASLMAFSEKCKLLRRLALKGCRLVSDLGMSWLAQGCPDLEHLDLSGCVDLTNATASYLGERCPKLRILNLFGLTCMSDTAVRSLSDGCPNLLELDLGGFYLLTDGKKRNFGLEGLQALGFSAGASMIKRLRLQGCFQIQTTALRSIAKLKELELLDLSSCTKLTFEGLLDVAKCCTKLNALNLSNCGNNLKDSHFEILVETLRGQLEHINLSRCLKVGSRAIKALALHSPNLQNLNLSECMLVADKDILFYCANTYLKAHKLTHIDLSHCPKISNDSLVALARTLGNDNGSYCPTSPPKLRNEDRRQYLTSISLKGTAVTRAEARMVRKKYMRYSSLHCEEKFFGFRESPRAKDLKFVRHHLLTCMANEKLERRCRYYVVHWIAQVAKRKIARVEAAGIVQKAKRRHQAIASLEELRRIETGRNECATKIQSLARYFVCTKILHQLKQCVARAQEERAATLVQKCIRQGMAREEMSIARSAKIQRQELEAATSCALQCFLRITWSRRDFLFRRKKKQEKDVREKNASILLQCGLRTMISKIRLRELQEEKRVKDELEAFSATTIATVWNYYKLRKKARGTHKKLKQELRAILRLQTFSRKMTGVAELRNRQLQNFLRCQQECAVILQYFSRRLKAVSVLRSLEQKKWEWEQRKFAKGPIIVHWCHFVRALYRAQVRKNEVAAFEKELMEYQILCATKISSCFWRPVLARRLCKATKIERNGKWKHMWSEEHQRPFYYNQWTGEWRWRPPMAVLEQQERPKCDNCDFFEAQMECASCREYFCHTCFSNVHSGGKRAAQHQFRALYNYYDKRIDYGDGVFPSIWPSESEEVYEDNIRLGEKTSNRIAGATHVTGTSVGASSEAYYSNQQHITGGDEDHSEQQLHWGGADINTRHHDLAEDEYGTTWDFHEDQDDNLYRRPQRHSMYHYLQGQQNAYTRKQKYNESKEGLIDVTVSP